MHRLNTTHLYLSDTVHGKPLGVLCVIVISWGPRGTVYSTIPGDSKRIIQEGSTLNYFHMWFTQVAGLHSANFPLVLLHANPQFYPPLA